MTTLAMLKNLDRLPSGNRLIHDQDFQHGLLSGESSGQFRRILAALVTFDMGEKPLRVARAKLAQRRLHFLNRLQVNSDEGRHKPPSLPSDANRIFVAVSPRSRHFRTMLVLGVFYTLRFVLNHRVAPIGPRAVR